MRRLKSGFSLVELMMTVVFLVIVASYAVIFGARSVTIAELGRARDISLAELTLARSRAMGGTGGSAWGIRFATSSITTFKGSSYPARDAAYDITTDFASNIIFSGATSIIFLPPEGTVQVPGTVAVTNGTASATISVNAISGISVQ
jgi:prepilin-type N-terminal cleavage/methylation domain-containing protein